MTKYKENKAQEKIFIIKKKKQLLKVFYNEIFEQIPRYNLYSKYD